MALFGEQACNDPVAKLPPSVMHAVFSCLPVDERACAACVCRGWRAALADPSLWTRLDLSGASGVVCRVDDAALRAAAARARGGLQSLTVPVWEGLYDALRAVVADNAATLQKLCFCEYGRHSVFEEDAWGRFKTELVALSALAPALRTMTVAEMHTDFRDARQMLRNEPPYGPLRLQRLDIRSGDEVSDIPGLAADMVAHQSLTGLTLYGSAASVTKPEELNLFFNAACTVPLTELTCYGFCPFPANAPALARFISSSSLTFLYFQAAHGPPAEYMLDAPAAALLAEAICTNCTLKRLFLINVGLFDDTQAAVALLGAFTGHVSLRVLAMYYNSIDQHASASIGEALGALITANSPLEELYIHHCQAGDSGLGPMVDALPSNIYLHTLWLESNGMTQTFAKERLLPAVHANTSLRELLAITHQDVLGGAAGAAQRFVQNREEARAAAEDAEL